MSLDSSEHLCIIQTNLATDLLNGAMTFFDVRSEVQCTHWKYNVHSEVQSTYYLPTGGYDTKYP